MIARPRPQDTEFTRRAPARGVQASLPASKMLAALPIPLKRISSARRPLLSFTVAKTSREDDDDIEMFLHTAGLVSSYNQYLSPSPAIKGHS